MSTIDESEQERISPKLYKLIAIGFVLFMGLKSFVSFLGALMYLISLSIGLDLLTSFWVSRIIPIILIVIAAYFISRSIWFKVHENPNSVHQILSRVIIFTIAIWIIQIGAPYFWRDYLYSLMPRVNGFHYALGQLDTLNIAKPVLSILQNILLIVAVVIRK